MTASRSTAGAGGAPKPLALDRTDEVGLRLFHRPQEAVQLPVVQGVVLMIAVIRICANLTVDVIYALIDPRIRYA